MVLRCQTILLSLSLSFLPVLAGTKAEADANKAIKANKICFIMAVVWYVYDCVEKKKFLHPNDGQAKGRMCGTLLYRGGGGQN